MPLLIAHELLSMNATAPNSLPWWLFTPTGHLKVGILEMHARKGNNLNTLLWNCSAFWPF